MMVAAPRARTVELIPALLVALLNDGGKLPPIPNEPRPGVLGFRQPTLSDMQSVSWVAYWGSTKVDNNGFRRVGGLATFSDHYDWHESADVREILALRGSKRSCVELTRWIIADGMEHGIRTVGAPAKGDFPLIHLMERLGAVITRRFMEMPCRS
jgi:hypothetical protein